MVRIRDIASGTTEVNFRGKFDPAYLLKNGDVLIGMDGDFLVSRWTGGDALLNQRVCKVTSKSVDVDQAFLFWFLQPHIDEIHRKTPQTTVRHLSTKDVNAIPAPDFSGHQQSKIAEVLDTIDAAIRGTEAVVAKLRAMKQGLLHDLLTRGIDANGDLRPPQSEAPHLYHQTPLGWLPKEWDMAAVGETISEPTRNGLYKPASHHGRGPLMVQMGCLFSDEAVDFSGATRVLVSPIELNQFGLENGDLLIARRSLVFEGAGLCAIIRNLPEPSTFESSIIRLRLRRSTALPDYAALFFWGIASSRQRRTLIRQVAVSGVSSADVKAMFIALPSLHEQAEVIARYIGVNQKIDEEVSILNKLRLQKSGLMDDLLTGRISVTPLL